jgi:Holliday junction resolvasome RuvABC endonuclease subunit
MTGRTGDPAEDGIPGPARWFARVVGIDVSLTSTGVAVHHQDGTMATDTIATKGKRGDTLVDRSQRIGFILGWVNDWLYPADLVVIEGPAGAAPGGSTWDRAGLWWAIVIKAMDQCSVAVVAPPTRAKWATGNGRADKAAVAVAMSKRAPEVELANSDEADALALAWMGAQWLGWRPVKNKIEQACLDVARWPA